MYTNEGWRGQRLCMLVELETHFIFPTSNALRQRATANMQHEDALCDKASLALHCTSVYELISCDPRASVANHWLLGPDF